LTDGILDGGKIYHESNLMHALNYSEKVREIQHPSSIMNIGKEDSVYMPKSNSVNTLLEEMYEYSSKENYEFGYWLKTVDVINKIARFVNKNGENMEIEYTNLISTIPLDKFLPILQNFEFKNDLKLECSPVYISNFKIEKNSAKLDDKYLHSRFVYCYL
jgi:hypothetical protein